jgi:hypothetical protein
MSLNDPEPPPRPPSPGDFPACWDVFLERCEFEELEPSIRALIHADIVERDAHGLEKYGVRLRPRDGRNTLHDLYQELLDALVYSVKALQENMNTDATLDVYDIYRSILIRVVDTRRLIRRVEGR